MRRGSAALVPLVAGLAWLAYKAGYLRLDAPPALQSLIISPALVLLVASAFVAFPDARRRLAGSLLASGLIAAVWTAQISLSRPGWTFYTPDSSMYAEEVGQTPSMSPPSLVAATLLILVGFALFLRRSLVGATLLGASFWLFLGFPQGLGEMFEDKGMARRYRYYYVSDERFKVDFRRKGVATVFLIGGVGLLARRKPIDG